MVSWHLCRWRVSHGGHFDPRRHTWKEGNVDPRSSVIWMMSGKQAGTCGDVHTELIEFIFFFSLEPTLDIVMSSEGADNLLTFHILRPMNQCCRIMDQNLRAPVTARTRVKLPNGSMTGREMGVQEKKKTTIQRQKMLKGATWKSVRGCQRFCEHCRLGRSQDMAVSPSGTDEPVAWLISDQSVA